MLLAAEYARNDRPAPSELPARLMLYGAEQEKILAGMIDALKRGFAERALQASDVLVYGRE